MGRRKKKPANASQPAKPILSGAKKRALRKQAEYESPPITLPAWQAGKLTAGAMHNTHKLEHKAMTKGPRKKAYRLTGDNQKNYVFGPVADAPKRKKRKK